MKFSLTVFILIVSECVLAQSTTWPFENEIAKFETQDLDEGSQTNFILFTGSSSIRLWNSLDKDFEEHKVLNRGFGGAKLIDLNFYWERILANHKPKMVVVYCGENDISDGFSVKDTFRQFKTFQNNYRKELKGVPLVYIAMKPSPDRWGKWAMFRATDNKIKRAIWWKSKQKYVDLSPSMLLENGEPNPDIFLSDELHMNEEGYIGWVTVLRPFLEKFLK